MSSTATKSRSDASDARQTTFLDDDDSQIAPPKTATSGKAGLSEATIKRRLRKLLAHRDQGRAEYEAADELLEQLRPHMKPGQAIDLGGGESAELVDNFATKNTVWKSCGIRRWDITTTRAKRTTKKAKPTKAQRNAKSKSSRRNGDAA